MGDGVGGGEGSRRVRVRGVGREGRVREMGRERRVKDKKGKRIGMGLKEMGRMDGKRDE